MVQLRTKRMRDMILSKHYKEPMEIMEKQIRIMKELPREVLQARKNYKK